jgi:uncharacterized protein involved in exopolysaccharide biosynthesis
MKQELMSLSARYTDQYPDVLALKDQIARTEKLRDALIAEEKANASDPKLAAKSATDGVQSGPLMQLQSQLQANQLEISNRERATSELMGRIGEYQGRLNEEPAVEQQVADLTRGYDQSKANYDDLLKKESESSMATSMEQMQQGQRFTMLDPPSLPVSPDFPNRLTFCGIGLGIGIAFGAIVVAGFEFLDDRLYREKDISAMLPIAVISEIPKIINSSDEEATKRKRTLGWAMAALTIVTILAGSAFSAIHG